jgi:hypothetical protein
MAILWCQEMDDRLRQLREAGVGYNQLGVVLGVHGQTVKRRLDKLGLPTWGRGGGQKARGPRATNRVGKVNNGKSSNHSAG